MYLELPEKITLRCAPSQPIQKYRLPGKKPRVLAQAIFIYLLLRSPSDNVQSMSFNVDQS